LSLIKFIVVVGGLNVMSKITKSARGKPCQLRLEECVSGGQNETTVFAHLNMLVMFAIILLMVGNHMIMNMSG